MELLTVNTIGNGNLLYGQQYASNASPRMKQTTIALCFPFFCLY